LDVDAELAFSKGWLCDDLFFTAPILPGEKVTSFSISFDWLGIEEPGHQFYEIVDPETFTVLDSSWTVPEPSSCFLFGVAFVLLRHKYNKQHVRSSH